MQRNDDEDEHDLEAAEGCFNGLIIMFIVALVGWGILQALLP